jgi:thiol-disulfide isomerase/thioredoxin
MLHAFYDNAAAFIRRISSGGRKITALSIAAFLILLLSQCFILAPVNAVEIKPLIKGDYAPAVTLISTGNLKETAIDFNPAASASPKRPALVWFWFISCENCVRDMKFMRELHKKYASKLSLIAVNVDAPEERGPVKNFIKNNGIAAYENYYDKITQTPFSKSYEASDKFGITSTPAVFIIDKTGRIALRAENNINFDELEDYIETVLSE